MDLVASFLCDSNIRLLIVKCYRLDTGVKSA